MEHTILFTRGDEPGTNAIIKLCTPDEVSAAVAFDRFHRGTHRWLTSTEVGRKFEEASCGDFNIGDFLSSNVTIPGDPEFTSILLQESVTFAGYVGIDHRVRFDRLLCNEPAPLNAGE